MKLLFGIFLCFYGLSGCGENLSKAAGKTKGHPESDFIALSLLRNLERGSPVELEILSNSTWLCELYVVWGRGRATKMHQLKFGQASDRILPFEMTKNYGSNNSETLMNLYIRTHEKNEETYWREFAGGTIKLLKQVEEKIFLGESSFEQEHLKPSIKIGSPWDRLKMDWIGECKKQ